MVTLPTAEVVAGFGGTIALITAIIVQLIKQGLIDPRTQDSAGRDALIRGITYALNLALLLGFLALNHLLDGSMALVYVSVALGQFGVAHVAYTVLSTPSANSSKVAGASNLGQPNDVKVLSADDAGSVPGMDSGTAGLAAPPVQG